MKKNIFFVCLGFGFGFGFCLVLVFAWFGFGLVFCWVWVWFLQCAVVLTDGMSWSECRE